MRKTQRNKLTHTGNLPADKYAGRVGLVYARVSSKKQETEGHGRDSQEGRCKEDLRSVNVPYHRTFPDTFTGAGDFMKRPAMKEMLDYIDANPQQKFVVVFDDLKRLARDVEAHFKLRTAFRIRDVELRCPNYNFDESEEGEFVELIFAGQAQLERKQNRRQVIQKMKARLEAGNWPFSRKKGYTCYKDPLHGKIFKPNKEGLKILKPALEGFARGDFPRRIDFCRYLHERGFWNNKRLPEKYLDHAAEILADPFWVGDVEYKPWGVARRQGHHQPLISVPTFVNIQKRLSKGDVATKVRKDHSEKLFLRGLVNCAVCGKHLTGGVAKGKYYYCWCFNRQCSVYRKMIAHDEMHKGFIKVMKNNRLKDEVDKLIDTTFKRVWKEEAAELEKEERTVIKKVEELQAKIADFADLARTAKTPHLKEVYEKQAEVAAYDLERIQLGDLSTEEDLTVPFQTALDKSKKLLKSPYSAWKKLEPSEQQELFYFIFDAKLKYHLKTGFQTEEIPTAARLFKDFVLANSDYVDLGGIGPPTRQCECRVIPLYYRPLQAEGYFIEANTSMSFLCPPSLKLRRDTIGLPGVERRSTSAMCSRRYAPHIW